MLEKHSDGRTDGAAAVQNDSTGLDEQTESVAIQSAVPSPRSNVYKPAIICEMEGAKRRALRVRVCTRVYARLHVRYVCRIGGGKKKRDWTSCDDGRTCLVKL